MTVAGDIENLDATAGLAPFPEAAGTTLADLTPEPQPASIDWAEFGLLPSDEEGMYILPHNVVAFETIDKAGRHSLAPLLAAIGVQPGLIIKVDDRHQLLYRVEGEELVDVLAQRVPDDARLIGPGSPIAVPKDGDWTPSKVSARTVETLSVLAAKEVAAAIVPATPVSVLRQTTTPLNRHSLRGESAVFRKRAIAATPLLDDLCLNGQVTVWYAAPNTGKTLIALNLLIEAVKTGRIAGENAYYVNADDGSEGLATKMELMDDIGVHTLVPGYRDFKANDLVALLCKMAERDEARGVLVLVDTTKKFTSLMDKKVAALYGNACRQVAMGGGAVLNLAHTNKAPKADGTPQFAGTTDLVEDCDAAYIIRPLDPADTSGEQVVEFKCIKRRGDNAETAAYGYAAEKGVDYVERLSSVRRVNLDALDSFKRIEAQRSDEEIIGIISACIDDGHNTKMILGKEAADRAQISTRAAHRIVERYTGENPDQHRWRFQVKEHGRKVFELLQR